MTKMSESEIHKELDVVERLKKAATDEDILRGMEIEEEIENVLDKLVREKEEMKEALTEKDNALEAKDKEIETQANEIKTKDKALEIKDNVLEAQAKEIAEHKRIIAELMKKQNNKK